MRAIVLSAVIVYSVAVVGAQVATETDVETRKYSKYKVEWPSVRGVASIPEWARPGRITFSRWDGGPIETAKAMLSGWPGFNPPIPEYLFEMTNWYDPRTVALLREASINTIWVTFSNGFSIPTEARQRELLRVYIDECHRQGIRVFAYHSLANMFWEDMFEKVPESRDWPELKDGKPWPYGAGDYTKMGRVTRYMADLSKAGWRDYLKRRIDLALDAGADGIMYDNCFSAGMDEVFQEIYPYAARRKRDFLMMANFHRSDFVFNRLINAITTEEGGEAGIFTEANLQKTRNRWLRERATMLPIEGGYLANNIGRFRIFDNLSEGWKPVMIESRLREVGVAETHVMSGPRHQLVMAENMAFNVANEIFVEGRFAHGLWRRDPEIVAVWRDIGRYNRFLTSHQEFYTGARPVASLAVVLDDRSEGEAILNGLAGRNVLYHVLYEHELTSERLKPYAAVLLLSANAMRDRAAQALSAYAGRILAAPGTAALDEKGRARSRPAFLSGANCTCFEKLPPVDELAAALKAVDQPPAVGIEAPPGLLYNIAEQHDQNRLMVHLINYTTKRTPPIRVNVPAGYRAAALISPDPNGAPFEAGGSGALEIPPVKIYSLLILEGRRTQ